MMLLSGEDREGAGGRQGVGEQQLSQEMSEHSDSSADGIVTRW